MKYFADFADFSVLFEDMTNDEEDDEQSVFLDSGFPQEARVINLNECVFQKL